MEDREIIDLYQKGSVFTKGIQGVLDFRRLVKGLIEDVKAVPFVIGNKELPDDYKISHLPYLTYMDEFSAKTLFNFADMLISSRGEIESFSSFFGFDMISPYEDNEDRDFMYISYKLNNLPSVSAGFSFKRDEQGYPRYSIDGRIKPLEPANELEREALAIVSR